MKKKIVYCLFAILVFGIIINGCGKKNDKSEKGNKDITIGSNIECSPFVNDLIKDFNLNNKSNIKQENMSFAVAEQKIKDKKIDIFIGYEGIENKSIEKKLIAYDGIAIIVNKKNSLNTINIEQLNKVYSGNITDWKEFNVGLDKILPISYENTLDFNKLCLNQILKYPVKETLTNKSIIVSDITSAKEKVASSTNYIAFVPAMYLGSDTKTLLLNGVILQNDSLDNELYPFKNGINFYYLKNNEYYKEIYEYIKSEDGKKIIKKHCSYIK